ncbi:MAG: M28 family peptidase [Gemmatimonadota bacterium]
MKKNLSTLLMATCLLGCSGQDADGRTTSGSGRNQASNAPPFSADSAYAYLRKQASFGPRVTGMPGHAAQLAWMKEFLATRADTVITQEFTHTHTPSGKKLQMTNLLARFKPTAETRILILAHWDTRPTADQDHDPEKAKLPIIGANDGASGVAVLLELANVLKNHSAPIGVDLLFVDGEDYGPDGSDMYLGANHFAANLMPGYKPMYGILLDMIGDQSPVYKIEGNSQEMAPEVVDRVWRTAERIGLAEFFPRTSQGSVTDDHLPLNRAGIRTIDIIDFDYPHWHTSQDIVENTSPRGLGAVGRVLTELIYQGG